LTRWGTVSFSRMSWLHVVRRDGLRAKIWTQYLPTIQHEFQPHLTVTLCSAVVVHIPSFHSSALVPDDARYQLSLKSHGTSWRHNIYNIFNTHPTNQVLTKHESGSNTPRLTTSRHLLSGTLRSARPFTKKTAILYLANYRYQTPPTG